MLKEAKPKPPSWLDRFRKRQPAPPVPEVDTEEEDKRLNQKLAESVQEVENMQLVLSAEAEANTLADAINSCAEELKKQRQGRNAAKAKKDALLKESMDAMKRKAPPDEQNAITANLAKAVQAVQTILTTISSLERSFIVPFLKPLPESLVHEFQKTEGYKKLNEAAKTHKCALVGFIDQRHVIGVQAIVDKAHVGITFVKVPSMPKVDVLALS